MILASHSFANSQTVDLCVIPNQSGTNINRSDKNQFMNTAELVCNEVNALRYFTYTCNEVQSPKSTFTCNEVHLRCTFENAIK